MIIHLATNERKYHRPLELFAILELSFRTKLSPPHVYSTPSVPRASSVFLPSLESSPLLDSPKFKHHLRRANFRPKIPTLSLVQGAQLQVHSLFIHPLGPGNFSPHHIQLPHNHPIHSNRSNNSKLSEITSPPLTDDLSASSNQQLLYVSSFVEFHIIPFRLDVSSSSSFSSSSVQARKHFYRSSSSVWVSFHSEYFCH